MVVAVGAGIVGVVVVVVVVVVAAAITAVVAAVVVVVIAAVVCRDTCGKLGITCCNLVVYKKAQALV